MSHKQQGQRILALVLTHLSTDRVARARWGPSWRLAGRPDGAPPIVIVDKINNAMRIVAHEAHVHGDGIYVGQSLSDARALCPELLCLHHKPREDADMLTLAARWCERYTPLVALNGDNGLYLNITGCAHLFGGEQALLEDLFVRMRAQGFALVAAIAGTAAAAFAAATCSDQMIVPPGGEARALAGLPLSGLQLEGARVAELNQLGFKTIGQLDDVPRAALTPRFGPHVLERLDHAFGRAGEVLDCLTPQAAVMRDMKFAEPIVYEDDIRRAIARLAGLVASDLERRGEGLRVCEVRLFRVDNQSSRLRVEAGRPERDPQRICDLFNERLMALHQEWDAGFGFDQVRLSVLRAEPLVPEQDDLMNDAAVVRAGDFDHLLSRLSARLGAQRVCVFETVDSHIPERRFGFAPALYASAPSPFEGEGWDGGLPGQKTEDGRQRTGDGANNFLHLSSVFCLPSSDKVDPHPGPPPQRGREIGTTIRPLILLARPEKIDVMAEVPEGPPLRFRWRKVGYEVVRSEGPERIGSAWWRDGRGAFSRDYFRVEARCGHRFWVFRHGLFGRETAVPHWYMHGLFA